MTFKNEAQLKRFLVEKCVRAVSNTERKVHEEFAGNLKQFYSEFHPDVYERTGALSGSLESTGTIKTGSGAIAEVYFNTPDYNTGTWSGETVLNVAMNSGVPHGGWAGGTAIWTESMGKLGGEDGIENLLIAELKAQGL